MLGRRNGVARGICYRLREDGRFTDKATSNGIHSCVTTMLNHGGFPAYQLVLGSNPVYLHTSSDSWDDVDCEQITWISSQLMMKWMLRVMAQEAMLKGKANGELRRIWSRAELPSVPISPRVIRRFPKNESGGKVRLNGEVRLSMWTLMRP